MQYMDFDMNCVLSVIKFNQKKPEHEVEEDWEGEGEALSRKTDEIKLRK